jgi:hypothetical protein
MKDIRSFFTKLPDKRKSNDQQAEYPAKKSVNIKKPEIDPNSFFAEKKISRTNNNLIKVVKKNVFSV